MYQTTRNKNTQKERIYYVLLINEIAWIFFLSFQNGTKFEKEKMT